jgi:hypothetical protein
LTFFSTAHNELRHEISMSRFATARFAKQRRWLLLALAVLPLAGCTLQKNRSKPTVEITQVPPSTLGGPSQMEPIAGRTSHTKPGDQIVLYAHSGVWWLQPLTDQPYTKILPDSSWKNVTHLGSDYAALLVQPGYHPASKIMVLPGEGNGVLAVAVAKGAAGSTPSTSESELYFSGYDWTVQTGVSDHGGQPYAYDPANVWTDEKGYLHLRMDYRNGRWSCAEVMLNRSLGYGTYIFSVEDTAHLRPSAVMGMFTWDDARSTNFRNELDMELSRWGDPNKENAQYVVQPFYAPNNLVRFNVPAGPITYMFRWQPGKVSFATLNGFSPSHGKMIEQHVFTSDIPTTGAEKMHIDLYDFHHTDTSSAQPEEVVIDKFEFLPLEKSQ